VNNTDVEAPNPGCKPKLDLNPLRTDWAKMSCFINYMVSDRRRPTS